LKYSLPSLTIGLNDLFGKNLLICLTVIGFSALLNPYKQCVCGGVFLVVLKIDREAVFFMFL